MSQFDDVIENLHAKMGELGIEFDVTLLNKVTKGLGPSIYNKDSSMVAMTDPEEVARVKNNFLIKKLGLEDSDVLDAAVAKVGADMKALRMKPRAIFYYLLVKELGQEAFYA